jgi:tetratricopeptide (TPR) repeat protein
VATALLVEFYRQLPNRQEGDDPQTWLEQFQSGVNAFKKKAAQFYNEGTLQRLLGRPDRQTRRAAVLALGYLGTMASNKLLAQRLHDRDEHVRQLAANALWALWFRADGEDNGQELQRLARLPDRSRALAGLNALIERSPRFAEAHNQRAILYFRARQYEKAIADCETVLALNPHHFGAQVGLAQCLMQLRRHRAALRAFRRTLRIHPTLDGVEETIRALEQALGEGGTRDDKK